ncbi:nitroreductase family protein [Streptantibioticus rubrisoli]|uniref:Nitroreductase family protein n=1 Tax=Streptantibioticus rubrisoli TaxID=1387313 RepID=A0ABT1PE91_9ACTN|nr:nitroreductase family protein [Streptantibioticus rubrisoli]MCQ4042783.1 nitroreductase family protein [Streptantibioticus rubrisoli]
MSGPGPRFCQSLAVATASDTLVIDGAVRRHSFTGKSVSTALLPLLPLLDGRRDTRALAAAAGLTAPVVEQVVELLDECGLLEYVSPQPTRPLAAPGHVRDYLSRTLGAVVGHRSAEEVVHVLAGSAAVIVGRSPAADLLADDLAEVGVGRLTRLSHPASTAHGLSRLLTADRSQLVVVFDDEDRAAPLRELVTVCAPTATPVLRCAVDTGVVQFGPLFLDGFTACPDCFHRGLQEFHAAVAAPAPLAAPNGRPEALAHALLAALAADQVLAVLAGLTEPTAFRTMTTVDVLGLAREQLLVTPYPDCARCLGSAAGGGSFGPAHIYEWQMERPPRRLASAGRVARADQERYAQLQRSRPDFPLSPRRALPSDRPSDSAHPAPLLSAIAAILRRTAGRRPSEGQPLARWTASGGNLGSVEAYVIAEDGLFDLPGAVVRYDDQSDEAVAVHAEPVSMEACLADSGLPAEGVRAVVVLVASVGRLGAKYGRFAHRLAHLDAGCAAVSLAVAAAEQGLAAVFAPAWRADLAELLELHSDRELVTALVTLRTPQER